MEPQGLMRVMAPFMGGMMRKRNARFLANLRGVLESESARERNTISERIRHACRTYGILTRRCGLRCLQKHAFSTHTELPGILGNVLSDRFASPGCGLGSSSK